MELEVKGFLVADEDAEIYRYFGYLVTSPRDIKEGLKVAGEEAVTLRINSPGGSLFAGYEMYCDLAAHPGRTTALIQGYAASAATVVMMGCQKVLAYPVSLVCIHNPSTYTEGDVAAHKKTIRELETVKESVISAYLGRARVSREELATLMDKDRYITAEEALDIGLVDEILIPPLDLARVANAAGYPVLTEEMRRMYAAGQKEQLTPQKTEGSLAKAYLELLKLS